MTAIAGIAEDGKVWIGGDAAGVGGLSLDTRTDPKVFVNGDFLFGYTSSFRMGQILEHEFSPPRPYEGEQGMPFMVKRFIPAVKTALGAGGYQTTKHGQQFGGTFLVGYRVGLYAVHDDYQVARLRQPFHAVGCGDHLAIGSLHATQDFELTPKERILMALQAAEAFSAGVRGPFTVLSV